MIPEIRYNPDADTVRREWAGPDAVFDPRTVPATVTRGSSIGFAMCVAMAVLIGAATTWVAVGWVVS